MFCMNCGQQLPDGAKFCLNCGTPQGTVSPIGTTKAETVNLDGMHTFVPAMCPNCNSHMNVDSSNKTAHCEVCGTDCLVQNAIRTLNVRGNVQVGNATINISGTNSEILLHRVEMMLADGDFHDATAKCETILDSDPTNGLVYLYMLMAELGCRKRSDLARQRLFDENKYYVKAVQFGDENLKTELNGYINTIHLRRNKPQIGDEIYFGSDYKQRIWWKVLAVRDNMAFIISCSCIGNLPYHAPGGFATWSKCSLRIWLNNEFINGYFTPEERTRILTCNNVAERRNQVGDSTTDRIFLLSVDETTLCDANTRACGFAWWLRSPGSTIKTGGVNTYNAAFVDYSGKINTIGCAIYDNRIGIRPAMWIKYI